MFSVPEQSFYRKNGGLTQNSRYPATQNDIRLLESNTPKRRCPDGIPLYGKKEALNFF